MLVLTRKVGEKVILTTQHGDRIEVIVSRIIGNQVKIAFDAPRYIQIDRAELLESDENEIGRQLGLN
jgi:carbon storage regulator